MVFEDQAAAEEINLCKICLENESKVVFCPYGHLGLCLECKYKLEMSIPREALQMPKFICLISQAPSTALMTIYV